MYPDGKKYDADIPAILTIGANYKFSDKLSAQVGYHTYFDKIAGWSTGTEANPNQSKVDKNYMELGLGLEYFITDKILISAGYLRATTGVNEYYQSDMTYSLNSNTFGFGGAYLINDMITINIGGYTTKYTEATIKNPPTAIYSQTYNKSNLAFAIGLDFAFGGK